MTVGRIVARGATFLFLAQIGSVIIGAAGSIALVRLLVSPGLYGFISVATAAPGLLMVGDVTGVNSALTKYLSQYKLEKDHASIWSSFWTAMIIKAVTGVILSAGTYFAAGLIASVIQKPGALEYFQIAAPLPFVWVTQVNLKSTLLALDASRGYSILQIVNEALLSFPPIVAVLLGLGAPGALEAMVVGNFVYLAITLGFSVYVIRSSSSGPTNGLNFVKTARKLLKFGAPLGFSNSYSTFTGQVVNLVIARFISIDAYGLYSVAQNVAGVLNYVSDPITTMLFPAYSRISSLNVGDLLRRLSDTTARYETAIVLPVTIFFIVFAKAMVVLLFGAEYAAAGLFLALLAATQLNVGLASDPISAFLASKGHSSFIGFLSIMGNSIMVVLALSVVPFFGLAGFLVAELFAFIPGYVLLYNRGRTALGLSPPMKLVLPFYFAGVATALVMLPVPFLQIPALFQVLVGLGGVPIVFMFFSVAFRGVDASDLPQIRELLGSQPLFFAFLKPAIALLGFLVSHLRTRRELPQSQAESGDAR